MALTQCPECGKEVSENAPNCLGCGNPIAAKAPSAPPAYPPPVAPAPPAGSAVAAGNGLSTAGIVCGIVSLFLLWFIFGTVGLILGAVAKSRGEQKANTAMVVSAVGLIGGALFSLVILSSY